ncbi:MAG: hypothetical protein AB1631_19580 [Acidobacteriota bacterium]
MKTSEPIIPDDSLSALRSLLGISVSWIHSPSLEVRGSFVYSWSFSILVHQPQYRYVLHGDEFVKEPKGDDMPERTHYLVFENKWISPYKAEEASTSTSIITRINPTDESYELSVCFSPLPRGIKVDMEAGREPALISPSTIDISLSDITKIIVCEKGKVGSNSYNKAVVFQDEYDHRFAIVSQHLPDLAFTERKKNVKSIIKTASRKITLER